MRIGGPTSDGLCFGVVDRMYVTGKHSLDFPHMVISSTRATVISMVDGTESNYLCGTVYQFLH